MSNCSIYCLLQVVMDYGRERKLSRDGWVEERCIGSGGFGTVILYENKVQVSSCV